MTSRLFSKAKTWAAALPVMFILTACTVPTPYQPGNGGYGYTDQQLEKNRYRVTFEGNSSTPRDDVQNYLLYRAAELTVQEGFDYFTIVDRDLERSTRYYTHAYDDDFGFGYSRYHGRRGYRHRRFLRPRYVSGTSYPVNEYSGTADIVLAEGKKPVDDANSYDALDVLQRLQPLLRQPAEK